MGIHTNEFHLCIIVPLVYLIHLISRLRLPPLLRRCRSAVLLQPSFRCCKKMIIKTIEKQLKVNCETAVFPNIFVDFTLSATRFTAFSIVNIGATVFTHCASLRHHIFYSISKHLAVLSIHFDGFMVFFINKSIIVNSQIIRS